MKRLLLLSGLLSACAAPVPWVNSRLPPSQWDADWSQCKRMAETAHGGPRDWNESYPSDPLVEYDRHYYGPKVKQQVESCMIGRGYVPATGEK